VDQESIHQPRGFERGDSHSSIAGAWLLAGRDWKPSPAFLFQAKHHGRLRGSEVFVTGPVAQFTLPLLMRVRISKANAEARLLDR